MMQVPEANPLQGLFHITVIRKIGIWGILINFKGLYSGRFITDRRVSTHTGKNNRNQFRYTLTGRIRRGESGSGTLKLR